MLYLGQFLTYIRNNNDNACIFTNFYFFRDFFEDTSKEMFPTSATKVENVWRTLTIRRILCVQPVGCRSAWIVECVVKVVLNFVTDCSGDSLHRWSICMIIKNITEHLSIHIYFCSTCAFVVYFFHCMSMMYYIIL